MGRTANNVVQLKEERRQRVGSKRMCFVVPEPLFREISDLADAEGESMTDIFKKSIKWYAHVKETRGQGKKIFVGNSARRIEAELLPL